MVSLSSNTLLTADDSSLTGGRFSVVPLQGWDEANVDPRPPSKPRKWLRAALLVGCNPVDVRLPRRATSYSRKLLSFPSLLYKHPPAPASATAAAPACPISAFAVITHYTSPCPLLLLRIDTVAVSISRCSPCEVSFLSVDKFCAEAPLSPAALNLTVAPESESE